MAVNFTTNAAGTYNYIGNAFPPNYAGSDTISFTNIPQTYTDLVLIGNPIGMYGSGGGNIQFRINSLSTGIYHYNAYESGGSNTYQNQTLVDCWGANRSFGVGGLNVTFFNYTNTSRPKTFHARSMFNSSPTVYGQRFFAGVINTNNAITSIQLPQTGQWAGCYFWLYGIKAA